MPNSSTWTEWSMTRSAGTSGLIRDGIAAHLGHRVAHGGQVDDARHAGEVLEDDAGRHERQLGLGGLGRIPGGQRAHVGRGDQVRLRRRAAQHVLEQDLDGVRQVLEVRRRRPRRAGSSRTSGRRRGACRGRSRDRVVGTSRSPPFVAARLVRGIGRRSAPDGCARPGSSGSSSISRCFRGMRNAFMLSGRFLSESHGESAITGVDGEGEPN